jgi:hypothetical protein
MLEFSQRLLGVSDKVMEPTKRELKDAREPSFVQQVLKEIHTSLTGDSLIQMNLSTLNRFVSTVNDISDAFAVESLYVWLRSILTMATTNSLFGSHNPMRSRPDLIGLYWYVAYSTFLISAFQ